MRGRGTTISHKTPNLTTIDWGYLRQISDTWRSYTGAKNTLFDMHLDLTRKSCWFINLYFRICRMFWKKNERSGKHVQHLEVFLFFNLVHCSIHVIVTLQPFLNTPFPSNKPPPPPFCPSFLAMDPIYEEESKYLLTIQMRNQWQVVSKEKKKI